MTRRPRILVLNQYYWPGVEATAHLLAELCEALAEDYDVHVVTGALPRPGGEAGRATRNGVGITRVPSTALDRSKLGPRAINYVTYLGLSLAAALRNERPDVVLAMTDPPIIGDVALAVSRAYRVPLIAVTQDVFPEIAVELGRLENPAVVALLRRMIGVYLRGADRVVAIGDTMRNRLVDKGVRPERIRVIPNWVATEKIQPQPRDNPWSREHGFADRFVVMHSGNIGHAQNLDSLVRAGTFLRDIDDLRIVLVGAGARLAALTALARTLDADNVQFLDYQPREVLSQSLSAASVHVVGLAHRLAGYVVPSRLYGVMSAGKPVIVAADEDSETARTVLAAECGIIVPPGRPELLAGAIRAAHAGEYDLEAMGRRAREYVTREFARDVSIGRYRDVIAELVERR